ncbi:MAG TPA: beta-ketoacyl-[acyl-carrier-protein] synthase family protein [Pirellulales bacterium]|jgi:3-oxoacyl-[acyl-carrier-protein] synthase II|nr:beta-ketoacyl-[acyl-carrier-protein] synthase family protein [Pirellulales bacterium]
MPAPREIVITGIGVVSPLGIGLDPFWDALRTGRSGVGLIAGLDASSLPVKLAAEIRDFDPMQFVKPRKSLKVMARDTQLGMTVAAMAREHARLGPGAVDPDRFGVVFSADTLNPSPDDSIEAYVPSIVDHEFHMENWGTLGLANSFPLGMLKLLPNMIACHISIAQDARAHNNTLYTGEVSSLLALSEAAQVIARGAADVMLAGGSSSRMQPMDWVRSCLMHELSHRSDEPERASRPFDLNRDGQVRGEGAAALVLEERRHAERRGVPILGRLLGFASSCDPRPTVAPAGTGLERAIVAALHQSGFEPRSLGHINAHAPSTRAEDRIEAQVLARVCPEVPVTALKSYFGNLYSAGGVVETAGSIMALNAGLVPATLNYEQPDPECPVSVIAREPLAGSAALVLKVSRTAAGQAAALVLAGP